MPAALVREAARVPIGTPWGEFDVRAFESPSELHLALVRGPVGDGRSVLARLHSECLTGDALGSLRCDCGVQLRTALRLVAAEGRGALVYTTGHEGRGIGLLNKLRAYMLQQRGSDTVDANRLLGLPVDGRDFRGAADVLRALGIRSVRLLTNNPEKAAAIAAAGIGVDELRGLPTVPHVRNLAYLQTKERRLGHLPLTGSPLDELASSAVDVAPLLGAVREHGWRPHVVLKYAQTLDGKIATGGGDSKWISGEKERVVSHALRAACDSVLVGIGTVLADDPRLTVRLAPGASPLRVVLDSTLRLPLAANVVGDDAATVVITTRRSSADRRGALGRMGVGVRLVPPSVEGVDLPSALRELYAMGIRSLLVEGGSRVITSMLGSGLADRMIVGVAPTIIGAGRAAVGDLGIDRVSQGVRLSGGSFHVVGPDLLVAGDVDGRPGLPAEDARAGVGA